MRAANMKKPAFAALGGDGLCAKALFLSAMACAAPLVALAFAHTGSRSIVFSIAALVCAYVCLAVLARSMRAIMPVATLLNHHARSEERTFGAVDNPARMLANLEAIAARLTRKSRKNALTGLPAREAFLARVSQDLDVSTSSAMLGLIRVANFDHLVAFNPEAANLVLSAVAERLKRAVRKGLPIGHVDRDCLAVWFGGGVEAEAANAELKALGYVLAQEVNANGLIMTPDIQLGSALYPLDADEAGNLLSRAYVSLARPQRTADGGVAFFARPSPKEAKHRFSIEQELRRAVKRDELALHYQPFVDLAMGRVVGAEALLRWDSAVHGRTSPAAFVQILEETGLVHEIGLWTIHAACRQLRRWSEQGLGDLKVAINLSAQQLQDRTLTTALTRTVAAHGLSPSRIELELTETAAMDEVGGTYALFNELREAGFSLAVDDFGSGYSSLAYLRRLPFQKLKIDREFVTQVDQRADSRTICKALIDLTAGLELAVLAEGVERFEEVETLRTMGCSTFQGFYFSPPLPADEFIATVTNTDWLACTSSRVHREREELRRRLL